MVREEIQKLNLWLTTENGKILFFANRDGEHAKKKKSRTAGHGGTGGELRIKLRGQRS